MAKPQQQELLRKPAQSISQISLAIARLQLAYDYEQSFGDPFGVAESIVKPLAQLKEVERRINEGEL